MVSTVIKLENPVQHFDTTIGEIEIKEPTGALYTRFGEPRVMVLNATGSGYWVEQPEIVNGYLEQCIKHAGDPQLGASLLARLSLVGAMAAREALLDFFGGAAARLAAKRRASQPTSSSSAPAS